MFNPTEADERSYLDKIIDKLEDALLNVDESVNRRQKELQEQKNYLYENKTGMDAAEKASIKQSVNMQAISGEAAVAYKERLRKLIRIPYLGGSISGKPAALMQIRSMSAFIPSLMRLKTKT